jgi:hypothetical protein
MPTKVTDLEKFALEQIFRPYQNMVEGLGEKRLTILPMSLDEVPVFIEKNLEWWKLVRNRIVRCKFYFPSYINHPIVDMVRGKT